MSNIPAGQVFSPPDLPPYLKGVCDLKPIVGFPSDEEVIGIHSVIRMAQKAVEIPGTGDPRLLARLAEHLFSVQMAIYRNKYMNATFPELTTYMPPTLPSHVTVQLGPITSSPSEEEIIKVQDAIRSYNQFVNVPSMFNPRVNMELSQHLFDIQMTQYTQRARQAPSISAVHGTSVPASSMPTPIEQTLGTDKEESATNNPGTGANSATGSNQSMPTISASDIRDCIEQSNRLAEQANQLADRSNLLIERSNKLSERTNQLMEQSEQPVAQSNKLVERIIELFGQLNQHFEQSNRLAELSTKSVEKLEEVLRNINRVLVGIQHAIIRNHKGNTAHAADCLVNERGDIPGQNKGLNYTSFDELSHKFGEQMDCVLPITVEGASHSLYIDNKWLGRLLRFYGVGDGYFVDKTSTKLKDGYATSGRIVLSEYLSACLG